MLFYSMTQASKMARVSEKLGRTVQGAHGRITVSLKGLPFAAACATASFT